MSGVRAAIERAARRYAGQGRIAVGFARGKLAADPAYAALVGHRIGDAARVVDLGCGRGYLLALIEEDARARRATPPELIGVEISRKAVAAARGALGAAASIVEDDLATTGIPDCDAAVLLDVLHYLDRAAQDRLLDRVRAALAPGGRIFVRDADAAGGASFLAVKVSEHAAAAIRGAPLRRFHYRSAAEWRHALTRLGLQVAVEPMRGKTPFANVLLVGRCGPLPLA